MFSQPAPRIAACLVLLPLACGDNVLKSTVPTVAEFLPRSLLDSLRYLQLPLQFLMNVTNVVRWN